MRRPHPGPKRPDAIGCVACGICCDLYGDTLAATGDDLRRWREQGRDDILQWVGEGRELWRDPRDGKWLESCPFLMRGGPDRAWCGIHQVKPDLCRDYPCAAHNWRCARRGGARGSV